MNSFKNVCIFFLCESGVSEEQVGGWRKSDRFGDSFGNRVGSVSTFLRYHNGTEDFQQGFS